MMVICIMVGGVSVKASETTNYNIIEPANNLINEDVERFVSTVSSPTQSYSASYDPRNTGRLTDVKLQNEQTCWMYASTACVEEYASIKNGVKNSLSELQGLSVTTDTLKLLNGISQETSCPGYYDFTLSSGGTFNTAMQYYTNWNQPSIPNNNYQWNSAIYSSGQTQLTPLNTSDTSALHVTGAKYIANDRNSIKSAILKYGAVYQPVYFDSIVFSLNECDCYYDSKYFDTPGGKGTNHAVCIVGWNDNYSKDNFFSNESLGYQKPAYDGAWLVRNSNCLENEGYYWISYAENSLNYRLTYPAVVTGVEESSTNKKMLSYDFLPITDICEGPALTSSYMANIYDTSVLPNDFDKITQIMTYIKSDGCEYNVYIIPAETKDDMPLSFANYMSLASGEFSGEGYITIDLDEPYQIVHGLKYAVVIELFQILEDNLTYMPCEGWDIAGSYDINQNESVFALDLDETQEWKDRVNRGGGNFCIRPVFESNASVQDASISPTVITNTGQDKDILINENDKLFSITTDTYGILREDIDYTRNGNTVTIKKEFISSLNDNYTELVFRFRDGITKTVVVNPRAILDRVEISGKNAVGQVLSAICYGNPYKEEYDVNYQWQTSVNGTNWYDISGATEKDYIVTDNCFLRYVRVKVDAQNNGNVEYPTTIYSSPTATKVIIYGDVDLNGAVETADTTTIQYYLAHMISLTAEQLVAADVDGDGAISMNDVTYLQQYLANYISKFPVEQ